MCNSFSFHLKNIIEVFYVFDFIILVFIKIFPQKCSFTVQFTFETKTNLEIKPLTILVGPNNAGKTSITDLFALFKQSTSGNYQPNSFFVFDGKEGIKGPLNRIINYKSMIEGVESKPMEIKIDLDIDCKSQNIEEDENIIVSDFHFTTNQKNNLNYDLNLNLKCAYISN